MVDDNALNGKLVRALMEPAGFAVTEACDGRTALAAASRLSPGLILLDIELPDMSGLALARRLKAEPATRGSCIVVLTAHVAATVEDEVRAAGCDGLMTKPLDPGTFVDSIKGFLGSGAPG